MINKHCFLLRLHGSIVKMTVLGIVDYEGGDHELV